MDLNSMKKKTPTTGWFTFDSSGVEIELTYESPTAMIARLERCSETRNGRTVLNQDKMLEESAALIRSWRGMTLARAAELMDLELPTDADLSAGVPCTKENKLALFSESWGFKQWLDQKIVALSEFVAIERERKRKNSQTPPSGGSPAASNAESAAK